MRALSISFACACLPGCAGTVKGYPGPEQPPEKIAVLHCAGPFQPHLIDRTEIDAPSGAHVEILPGEHLIIAGLYRGMPDGGVMTGTPRAVTFTAAAGDELYCVADVDAKEDNWSLDTMPKAEFMAAIGRGKGFLHIRRERTRGGTCFDYLTGQDGSDACPVLPAFEATDVFRKKR